jgi:hypothetical protein
MKQVGGIHITEERELRFMQHRLANFPEAIKVAVQGFPARRRPIAEISAPEVESWARSVRLT